MNKMYMMKRHAARTLAVAMAAAALTACSSDSGDAAAGSQPALAGRQPILLGTDVAAPTRAADPETQSVQIASGQTVYCWVDEHTKPAGATDYNQSGDQRDYIRGWQLTADGNGGLNDGSQPQYYPASGYAIDLFALHGNFTETFTEGHLWSTSSTLGDGYAWTPYNGELTLTHTVMANQTGAAMGSSGNVDATTDGYQRSDLLYARAYDRRPSTGRQILNFSHLLSKVEVYVLAGNGVAPTRIVNGAQHATVQVMNTQTTVLATFHKLSTASPSYAVEAQTGSEKSIHALMTTLNDNAGITVNVPQTSGTGTEALKAYVKGEAVVAPQWVNSTHASGGAEVDFLTVTLPSGGTFVVKENRELQTGKKYIYYVIVDATGFTYQLQVIDWKAAGSTTDGSATWS